MRLTEGSVVTTLKNTVDHVVTEFGLARLRGRSLSERAEALIAIAHPDHREELEREAHEAGLLRRAGSRAGSAPCARRERASAPTG
jgi:acyl-CoA hydrolase